jgi:tRNA(adenine34) deaminase
MTQKYNIVCNFIPKIITYMENLFTDEYFMQKALQEAQTAYDKGEVPIGAVIVVQNQIIARSHNLTEQLTDVTAHAEMQCITAAANFIGGKYLKGCTIYITLEPCVMCAGALYWSQIDKVVFGASEPKRGFRSTNIGLHPKTIIESGVLKDKCEKLLVDFFKNKRGV